MLELLGSVSLDAFEKSLEGRFLLFKQNFNTCIYISFDFFSSFCLLNVYQIINFKLERGRSVIVFNSN